MRTSRRSLPATMLLVTLAWVSPVSPTSVFAHDGHEEPDKFRQLEETLPTPNEQRGASGAPGHAYWQQRADYEIDVALDEALQRITGSERITYHNHSPDALRYLWLQLDGNIFHPSSAGSLTWTSHDFTNVSFGELRRSIAGLDFDGSFHVTRVETHDGTMLPHTVVGTMMRVDLDDALEPGSTFEFDVDWNYTINDAKAIRARTGYEHFPEDGNTIYEIAQWFPRMVSYTDVHGWHHKQFLGRGEFTLELGDYTARITVPDDHVVAATGVLQNPGEVLTETQRARLDEARGADEHPVFIVTPEEARANESSKPSGTKTWVFHADNVRDFAFATSRKFIWDAQEHCFEGHPVLAMSFYPNEGEPLWSRYSTRAILHTLDVYSRHTFPYPYPVAISVNGPVGGMEYPMICFNGPRPEKDGTYSKRTKYGLISVIIHEVGHNYFPMIVNSDERQWTWMDEGLNTFLQYLAEQEWEEEYPSRRGEPKDIVAYMTSDDQVPIMTNSESIHQFGNNAYAKPATALNILRETILGRELFDFSFREYARRWRFKRPMPADFFRTMEDASGIDLDWFWRGWFYTTDHVDVSIDGLREYILDTGDPEIDKARDREDEEIEPETISELRNRDLDRLTDRHPELKDFYNEFDEHAVTEKDRKKFTEYLESLEDHERSVLAAEFHFTVLDFTNRGGLVTPVILEIEFADGAKTEMTLPAEIWRQDPEHTSKLLLSTQEIVRVVVDPHLQTADTDLTNNTWPAERTRSRFKLRKEDEEKNPMQEVAEAEEAAKEAEAPDAGGAAGGGNAADSAADAGEAGSAGNPGDADGAEPAHASSPHPSDGKRP